MADLYAPGQGGEREEARAHAYAHPEQVAALIDILIEATARYMAMQARAGAQALQIFESWAEGLPDDQFRLLVTEPHARLIARLRELGVDLPLIGFPRGAGALLTDYAAAVPVQGLGLDTQTPLAFGKALQAAARPSRGRSIPFSFAPGDRAGPPRGRAAGGLVGRP